MILVRTFWISALVTFACMCIGYPYAIIAASLTGWKRDLMLAAVQALYQMEVSGVGAEAVIREFTEHRFDRDIDRDVEG